MGLAVFLLGISQAWAQSDQIEIAGDERESRAKVLYDVGTNFYAEGDYEKSAEAFLESYELSGNNILLFNLGNAYERAGNLNSALEYLELYKKSANETDRVFLEKRIERLRLRQKSQSEESVRVAALESENATMQEAVERERLRKLEPKPQSFFARNKVALGLGAAAVVLVGTGAGFAGAASNADDRARLQCGPGGLCLNGAEKDLKARDRWALAADLSFGAALVCGGFSAYFFLRNRDEEPKRLTFTPTLSPSLAGVQAHVRF